MEEEIKTEEKVSWSMDVQQLQTIGGMMREADGLYILGKFDEVANMLRACKFVFIHSLNESERDELKSMEAGMVHSISISKLPKYIDTHGYMFEDETIHENTKAVLRKAVKLYAGGLQPLVEAYRERIMDLLNQYGYLQKHKKDLKDMGV